MSAAYWLALALATLPLFGYLVGMVTFGAMVGRASRPAPRGLPVRLLAALFVPAFGFALWQQLSLDFFFDPLPSPTGDDPVSREVVGVTISLEVGSAANDLAASVFWLLVQWGLAVLCFVAVFRPKPPALLPLWGQNILLVIFAAAFVWLGWGYLSAAVKDWQRLFG